MIQGMISEWTLTGCESRTECAVLALPDGYRVIVRVNGTTLSDEIHATRESAMVRAEDLRAFMLAQGMDEDTTHLLTVTR